MVKVLLHSGRFENDGRGELTELTASALDQLRCLLLTCFYLDSRVELRTKDTVKLDTLVPPS